MARSIREGSAVRDPEPPRNGPVKPQELEDFPRMLERLRARFGSGGEYLVRTEEGPKIVRFKTGVPEEGLGYLHESRVRAPLVNELISQEEPPVRRWGENPVTDVEPGDYDVVSMMTTGSIRGKGNDSKVSTFKSTHVLGLVVPERKNGEPKYIPFAERLVEEVPDAYRKHVGIVSQISNSNRIR